MMGTVRFLGSKIDMSKFLNICLAYNFIFEYPSSRLNMASDWGHSEIVQLLLAEDAIDVNLIMSIISVIL